MTRLYLMESTGSAPTLQRSRGLKMLVNGGEGSRESLIDCFILPPQAPSQCREENGTGPIRGFIQMNACGGDDEKNLMCLL